MGSMQEDMSVDMTYKSISHAGIRTYLRNMFFFSAVPESKGFLVLILLRKLEVYFTIRKYYMANFDTTPGNNVEMKRRSSTECWTAKNLLGLNVKMLPYQRRYSHYENLLSSWWESLCLEGGYSRRNGPSVISDTSHRQVMTKCVESLGLAWIWWCDPISM